VAGLVTFWRPLLGVALAVAGLVVLRDPDTARRLVGRSPAREDDTDVREDHDGDHRRRGDHDGRARAAGAFLFVAGVTLLLGDGFSLR
jgi:hypothetical protein